MIKLGILAVLFVRVQGEPRCTSHSCSIADIEQRGSSLLQSGKRVVSFGYEAQQGSLEHQAGPSAGAQERTTIPAIQIILHVPVDPMHVALDLPLGPYFPLLAGLKEAFQGQGLDVSIGNRTDEHRFLEQVRRAPQCSTWLISVNALWYDTQSEDSLSSMGDFFSKATQLGARLVLYQTEPSHSRLDRVSTYASKWGVSEVWDYSRRNQHTYSSSLPTGVVTRFVPPGYASSLDFGVDIDSGEKNETSIFFLGIWAWRPSDVQRLYSKELSGFLHDLEETEHKAVWIPDEYRRLLTRFPIQLNVHHEQSCCPSSNAMEAFRMALLLSNKVCVISAPVDPRDEEIWRDFVKFSEPSVTKASLNEVMRQGSIKCRMKSYEAFKREFSIEVILRRSGAFREMGI